MARLMQQGLEAAGGEKQEALFMTSSSYPLSTKSSLYYYVQSPSSSSSSNTNSSSSTTDIRRTINPSHSTALLLSAAACSVDDDLHRRPHNIDHEPPTPTQLVLSPPYSSFRGSNNNSLSFLNAKKKLGLQIKLAAAGSSLADDDDGGSINNNNNAEVWRKRFVARDSSSPRFLQVAWKLFVGACMALLVFFVVTRPPPPKVAFIKEATFQVFGLGEGVDRTGVPSKILSFNASVDMEVINLSKFYGLHVGPATMEAAFGPLKLATSSSKGKEWYVGSGGHTRMLKIQIGVRDEPMYAAGQAMQDMLQSAAGSDFLPFITLHMSLASVYHIVWNIINTSYRHHAECLVFISAGVCTAGDVGRQLLPIRIYNSSCATFTTTHA